MHSMEGKYWEMEVTFKLTWSAFGSGVSYVLHLCLFTFCHLGNTTEDRKGGTAFEHKWRIS